MKEVIKKKLLFWMVLIVGIVALIGSCAKKDDSTTTTTLSAPAGLTATGGVSQVALDWTAVSGAQLHGVLGQRHGSEFFKYRHNQRQH